MQRKRTSPKQTPKQAALPTVDSPDRDTPAALAAAIEAHRVFLEMEIMAFGKGTPSGAQERYRGSYERGSLLCKADPSLPPLPVPETDPDVGLHTLQLWCIAADAVAVSQAGTPELNESRLRVRVGGTWYDIADEASSMLSVLFQAKGAWVQGKNISKRPDKTRKQMPPAVSAIIESHQVNGYRIPSLLSK